MLYLSVNPSKMQRAKNNKMKENTINEANKCNKENNTAYDGRKDWIKMLIPDNYGKLHPRVIKEEHTKVTCELDVILLIAHITP